jgi:hypothetical protein
MNIKKWMGRKIDTYKKDLDIIKNSNLSPSEKEILMRATNLLCLRYIEIVQK